MSKARDLADFVSAGNPYDDATLEVSDISDLTATASELNVLDGITADVNELNLLDGVTATTTELNYNDITTLGTSEASKVVTADADGVVKFAASAQGKSNSLTGTTPSVDCKLGDVFTLTTSGNTTFTFSNAPASGVSYAFILKITAGGTHTLTWPASVDWAGGSAPDAPASGETDVYVFLTSDGGTTWYGFLSGDALA